MIQLVDLDKQYVSIKDEVNAKIDEVIRSKAFIQGKYAGEFEKEFAAALKCKHAIGCSNGTTSIFLALAAIGIGNGDEVITTTNTFVATAEAICHAGAKPVFVDIDPETYNMDVNKIEALITPKTRALMPVHIYGNPVDMVSIMALAKKHNLKVVEDCAQSHLAAFDGKCTGTSGDAGTFSFYPGKNLGAYGDAGAVVTNSDDIAKKSRVLLDHGRESKYCHNVIGYNLRMDGLQAGILSVKLKHLRAWTKMRQENASLYNSFLKNSKNITTPTVHPKAEHVYHLYVVQVNNRDEVLEHLKNKGIAAGIHYPIPLHLQPAFGYLGYKKGNMPVAEKIVDRIVSLPMYPELTKDEIQFICSELTKSAK